MSRPLRLDFPGAWHHVMNRGRRRERIFIDEYDYESFLKILRKSAAEFGVCVAGYCLMPNHYHLLIHTPEGNLSRFMRQVGSVYTQAFNKRHDVDGQLFRGRYKSILVEADDYLLKVLRYIHRNPLKSGLSSTMRYKWSSHGAYLGDMKNADWVYSGFILQMLADDLPLARKLYREFAAQETDTEADALLSRPRPPVMLGCKAFIERCKRLFQDKALTPDIPESRALVPSRQEILEAVCRELGQAMDSLTTSRRGTRNDARNLSIHLLRVLRREPLRDIAQQFGMVGYSSVSSVLRRIEARLERDKAFRELVKKIRADIMGQE